MKSVTFSYGVPHRVVFSETSQINQTKLVHNFTEAAGFKV